MSDYNPDFIAWLATEEGQVAVYMPTDEGSKDLDGDVESAFRAGWNAATAAERERCIGIAKEYARDGDVEAVEVAIRKGE